MSSKTSAKKVYTEVRGRALGIITIGDKLLQTAVAKILGAIYEQDFLSCSYGYRLGKSAHGAIKALTQKLMTRQFHYIVEADIKNFFGNIDHGILLKMIEKRVNDRPFINLIRKWLKAGILENGQVICPATGTPQGGVVSPILANIYLHYVLDVWFYETVQKHCRGKVYLCRYADDFVCAFEYKKDAKRFYKALKKRLKKFKLELSEEKTNILVFSPVSWKMKTNFEFLSFEFRWGINLRYRNKDWCKPIIKRRTSRKKLSASLANFKYWFKKNCRLRKLILFKKLNRKLIGYYNYYGIKGNYKSLNTFLYYIMKTFLKWLNRRSQRKSYNWKGFKEMIKHFGLAKPRVNNTI